MAGEHQILVDDWVRRTFGAPTALSMQERALRVLEEAAELAQAVDLPPDLATKLLRAVYARPAGSPYQEVGGICITLLAFCQSANIDRDDAEFRELRRILSKDAEHFRRRQAEKITAGVGILPPEGVDL